jgi:hypothetical protein
VEGSTAPDFVPMQLPGLQAVLSSCLQLKSLWLGDVHVVEQGPLSSQSLQELQLGCVTPYTLPGGMDLSGLPCLSQVHVSTLRLFEGYFPHGYYAPETVHQLAQVLASWNVQGCFSFDICAGPSYVPVSSDERLSPSLSLAYAQALLPLLAAEWPKRVKRLNVRSLSMEVNVSAPVREVIRAIFPAAQIMDF